MHDDDLPLAIGQPPSAAKMTTLHTNITYKIQVALGNNEYSFRSAEHDGRRVYALMREKNGRFSMLSGFSEKEIEGRSEEEVVNLIVHFMEIQRSVKSDCTKVCAVLIILLIMSETLSWIFAFTPFPPFLFGVFIFIGIIATIYIGVSRTFSRALAIEE